MSVVLPTRDRLDRLPRALSSVLGQTHRALELVVVDDGSHPGASRVVDQVVRGDRRVHFVDLVVPRGAAHARNVALSKASGDIIAFIDDDDWWMPAKLEKQVSFLSTHPDTGIVTGDFMIVREDTGPAVSGARAGTTALHYRGPRDLHAGHLLWFNLPGSFLCGALRRSVAEDEMWLDESFPSVEDWDFWVRCARRTRIGVIPAILGFQSVHGDGRLSDPVSNRRGLDCFVDRHGLRMSPPCRAFVRAHSVMEKGEGWAKRAHVIRSLATASPRASALLLAEQAAAQAARVRADPGLVHRFLARAVPIDTQRNDEDH